MLSVSSATGTCYTGRGSVELDRGIRPLVLQHKQQKTYHQEWNEGNLEHLVFEKAVSQMGVEKVSRQAVILVAPRTLQDHLSKFTANLFVFRHNHRH